MEKKRDYMVIITVLSLLLVFTGLRLNHVISWSQSVFAPKALDEIVNYDVPQSYDWYEIKEVSDVYYIESDISIKPLNILDTLSGEIVYDSNIRIIVKLRNHGKKEVENPILEIIILDPFLRMRANWTRNLIEKELDKKTILKYGFPDLDSKIMGFWRLDSFLYDDMEEKILISYSSQDFSVQKRSYETVMLIIVTILVLIVAIVTVLNESKKLRDQILSMIARVRAKAEQNRNHVGLEKSPLTSYRQEINRKIWHWCTNCSNWPKDPASYTERARGPRVKISAKILCKECLAIEKAGTCIPHRM